MMAFSIINILQQSNSHNHLTIQSASAKHKMLYYRITRSSVIAEGPHNALCQLKSCQLPCNSAETTCTTSFERIEVIKLKPYSKRMCNNHVHSAMTRSSRFRCPIGVINKPTTVELWIPPVYRRLAVAKFSKSTMLQIVHVTLTTPTQGTLTHHKTKTSHGRLRTKFEVSSISCGGEIT